MSSLDDLLYQWIRRANERRDDFELPVGLIEESIALLKRVLGPGYLEELLIRDSEPVHFLDDEANPLRKWLLSAMVDAHVIQVLELAAYFKAFDSDSALGYKVEKLKRDSFWPVFFELAMATRVKRATGPGQHVRLNPEDPTSVGDFTIGIVGFDIPCECSRLGHSPQITEPEALKESLSNRISDGTQRIAVPLCVKIRTPEARSYNRILRLIRKGLADARTSRLPAEHRDGSTVVRFEVLTGASEQIPFQMLEGRVVNVLGTDWDSATRLCRVPARDSAELAERFEKGERFYEHEAVRLFTKFGPPESGDYYERLGSKLKKKVKQTKTSSEHFGKIVLVEVPFDLRTVDTVKLTKVVREAAMNSRTTLAIVLANREPNPQIRHHYSHSGAFNQTAARMRPEVVDLFSRIAQGESSVDPILGWPYRRSWTEAQSHVAEMAKSAKAHLP
ncbi:MAG: hypothetical protein ACYDA9_09665 [Terriglobia bacterium]